MPAFQAEEGEASVDLVPFPYIAMHGNNTEGYAPFDGYYDGSVFESDQLLS